MRADPLGLLDRVGAALTGEGSLFDGVRRETSLDRLSEMLPYRLHDEQAGLYLNARSCGFVLEIVPLLGADDAAVAVLAETLSEGIPDHAHLQIINWASPRIGPVLDGWAAARGGEAGVLKTMALHRVDHLRAGAFESLSREAPFLARQFRVFLALGLAGDADQATRERLAELRANIAQALKSIGVASREVGPDALIRFLDDVLNPRLGIGRGEAAYDESELLGRQVVRPDTKVRVEADRLLFDTIAAADRSPFADPEGPGLLDYDNARFDVRAFSARKFPERFHQAGMASAIGHPLTKQLRLPCPVLSCLAISFGSKDGAADLVGAKFGRAEQQAGTNMVRFLPELSEKAEDWKWVREHVRGGARLVRAGYFLVVFAREGEAEPAERALRSLYKNMGWDLAKDRFVAAQSLAACLPLTLADGLGADLQTLRRLRFMVTDTCVQVAPLQGEYLGGSRPDLLLLGRRGQPFFWSPFANEGAGNHNVSIIGSSGSGKSVLMQELVTGLRGAGAAVVVIDDGESSKHTCRALGGRHVTFTLKDSVCLNPFSLLDETRAAKDSDYRAESLTLVRAMIEQMAKGEERASAEERGLIDGAVSEVWKAAGAKAGIDEVAEILRGADGPGIKLANALKPYSSAGLYGAFFNGEASLAIDNPLTVFEMKDLDGKTELRAVVMLALMFLINQRMMRDRREKMALVIDEAWALLGKGAAGDFIAGFARRCRKYGGAIITGTQGIDDYYATDGARAAFENSDWTILLRMKPEPLAQVLKNDRLSIDEGTADLIRSLSVVDGEYSELLIMGPQGRHVGRLVLDPFSAALTSSSATTFAEIDRLEQSGLSTAEAVERVAFGGTTRGTSKESVHAA
ncbi:type IV secretion system protein TraC [Parvularcula oceani]|uniref:type IV secretion system protein TraC n=1 Tax=Parvularcula oceani TaxID=1247963 RepID=UPI00068C966E|nr:type IV secretion system protein TraC [Parvularcula oceani]